LNYNVEKGEAAEINKIIETENSANIEYKCAFDIK